MIKGIKVYFTPGCSACKQVKDYLFSKNIPFEPIDLTKIEPREQSHLISQLGRLSVPIIKIEGQKPIFSLSELKEIYE